MKSFLFFIIFSWCCVHSFSQEILYTLEAENADLTPPVKKKYVNGYSGNAYVGDNDPGSKLVFRNIDITEEGTYEFKTYYTSMHIRSITIQSGNYPKVVVTMPTTTEDWNRPPVAVMVTYIYLDKGSNTIVITPHNGGGPNIDKFEIVKTSVTIPRPEPLNSAFAYDLTDDALVTSNRTITEINNVTDNNTSTVYTFNESSAEIKIECDMPYLLTSYLFSAGNGSTSDVKNWKIEYSVDGNSYSLVNPNSANNLSDAVMFEISRTPHSDKSKAAKYYRITAYDGRIGEIQLFGIPYLPNTNNKNFPVDMTEGMNISQKTLGDPLGVSGSFDERYYNLFDRDMSRKYYWHSATSFWVDVELENLSKLNYYTLTSCQDYPERDPKSWVLEGFDRDWVILDEVSDFIFPSRYATMKFFIEDEKLYKGYRLRVTQNNGADAFQLLKWQLFGSTNTSSLSSLDTDNKSIMVYSLQKKIVIDSEDKAKCYIFNLSGHLIATYNIHMGIYEFPVESGIYIVKFIASGKSYAEKVIVR